MFAVCGALFVASGANSEGTDLRPGRHQDLASLVRSESQENRELEARAQELREEIDRLSGTVVDRQVRRQRRAAERLEGPAGLREVTGDAIKVTLADAPAELREEIDPKYLSLLVVHQQDIQAVVNAMWRAGAKAITIQGQRVISTTGIKCAGNSVELHGIPYSQPYEIVAVGDTDVIEAEIDADSNIDNYREQADNPAVDVGWELEHLGEVTAPAYDGLRTLEYAQPLT